MAINTGLHRIRIEGQDHPLHGFAIIPAHIPPAGVAPGVEDAMRAYSPPQPQTFFYETVAFNCDLTLSLGEIYDYFSTDDQQRDLKILAGDKHKYRGVF